MSACEKRTAYTGSPKDYIDPYQCHAVNDEQSYNQIISPGGALEGLIKAKEEGLIGHIGITSHSLDLLDRVLLA
jgi:predicted aldo/keto reductase-like oxidoreductase